MELGMKVSQQMWYFQLCKFDDNEHFSQVQSAATDDGCNSVSYRVLAIANAMNLLNGFVILWIDWCVSLFALSHVNPSLKIYVQLAFALLNINVIYIYCIGYLWLPNKILFCEPFHIVDFSSLLVNTHPLLNVSLSMPTANHSLSVIWHLLQCKQCYRVKTGDIKQFNHDFEKIKSVNALSYQNASRYLYIIISSRIQVSE